jgi:hypothetical protein
MRILFFDQNSFCFCTLSDTYVGGELGMTTTGLLMSLGMAAMLVAGILAAARFGSWLTIKIAESEKNNFTI